MFSSDSSKDLLYPLIEKNAVYRTFDRYGEIVVYETERGRILTFGSISEQTCINFRDPAQLVFEYTQAMLLPLLAIKPTHITLLGLGGGALANGLLHVLPDAALDIVELRRAVIDVARTHFFFPVMPQIKVNCMDAGAYVREALPASTELLLCDLYDAYEVSELQLDVSFYRHCKRLLSDEGWLAINFHILPSIEHPVIQALCNEFSSVYLCVVNSGNWIILASNTAVTGDKVWLQQQIEGPLRRQLAAHRQRLIHIEV